MASGFGINVHSNMSSKPCSSLVSILIMLQPDRKIRNIVYSPEHSIWGRNLWGSVDQAIAKDPWAWAHHSLVIWTSETLFQGTILPPICRKFLIVVKWNETFILMTSIIRRWHNKNEVRNEARVIRWYIYKMY